MNAMNTCGEWSCGYGDFSVFCETGAEIARVMRGEHDDGSVISCTEMEANLNLIAAAPELLKALRIAVEIMKDSYIDEELAGQFEIFTDAIARAEGRGET